MLGKSWSFLFLSVSAIGWSRSLAFSASRLLSQQSQRTTTLYGSDMGYDDNSGGYYEDNSGGYYEENAGYYEEENTYVDNGSNNNDLLLIREFLQEYFPAFYTILDMNEEVWKAIGDTEDGAEVGFTVFAPSAEALNALGQEKQNQLMDERNVETTQKIAGYHVIGEPVTEEALFNSGGVVTVSGEVPVERSISGGLFGIGGKEDGGVTLNQAKILRTASVGNGLVHEVDNLVSPNILWRYMDQLRIPGST